VGNLPVERSECFEWAMSTMVYRAGTLRSWFTQSGVLFFCFPRKGIPTFAPI
jgi:hypothetical protein